MCECVRVCMRACGEVRKSNHGLPGGSLSNLRCWRGGSRMSPPGNEGTGSQAFDLLLQRR